METALPLHGLLPVVNTVPPRSVANRKEGTVPREKHFHSQIETPTQTTRRGSVIDVLKVAGTKASLHAMFEWKGWGVNIRDIWRLGVWESFSGLPLNLILSAERLARRLSRSCGRFGINQEICIWTSVVESKASLTDSDHSSTLWLVSHKMNKVWWPCL